MQLMLYIADVLMHTIGFVQKHTVKGYLAKILTLDSTLLCIFMESS